MTSVASSIAFTTRFTWSLHTCCCFQTIPLLHFVNVKLFKYIPLPHFPWVFWWLTKLGFVLGWSAVQKLIHKEIGIMTYLSPNRLRLMQHFSLNCFCHHWGYSLIPRTTPTRNETKIEFLHLHRHPTNMPLKNLFCSLFLWNLFCSLLDFLSNYFISSAFFHALLILQDDIGSMIKKNFCNKKSTSSLWLRTLVWFLTSAKCKM